MLLLPLSDSVLVQANRPSALMIAGEVPPHPWAHAAAQQTMMMVRKYMVDHANSELYRQGKMFGVLVVDTGHEIGYLRAFSAMLDGTYHHTDFVPPIYDLSRPDGYFRQEEARISAISSRMNMLDKEQDAAQWAQLTAERKQRSQALQRWMFSQYLIRNAGGQQRDLLQLFANEKPILSEEDYFARQRTSDNQDHHDAQNELRTVFPPSGAGECCAPKLLQTAFMNGWQPLAMAEFWMGAPSSTEVRMEGQFYPPCVGKCKPILRHMLSQTPILTESDGRNQQSPAELTQVVYEDEVLMVVNKPAGLLSQPGKTDDYSLQDWACRHTGHEVWLAHRLDQDTSGLLVIAKTRETYGILQRYFLRRDVYKRYEAILTSSPILSSLPLEGLIDLPLLPDPYDRPRQMVNREHGKPAITRYAVRQEMPDGRICVDLFPHTGRTHQLRVHCAHPLGLGRPITGDRLYGQAGERLLLHAAEIRFPHPISGRMMQFVVPAPFLSTDTYPAR
ncbi:MAG: RluA family pseudouridine synthase [Paludibacteraceae bacterium]|nr:RluA family pseudouridine synthase [Paludibacteraceae bacterium]